MERLQLCLKIKQILISLFVIILYQSNSVAAHPTDSTSLKFGILPYLSTKVLIKKWTPFIRYLEHALNKPIVVSTAPNFRVFLERAKEQQYDIYFTAPHFAALAEYQQKYQRLAGFNAELHGEVIVLKSSPYQSITDLKNKLVVTPDKLAVITLLGEDFLKNNGLIPGKTVQVKHLKSHNNALYAVSIEQADAAIVVGGMLARANNNFKKNLRIISITKEVPHTMLMLKSTLTEDEKNKIKRVVNEFSQHPEYSKPLYKNIGFGTFKTITDKNMQRLKPILPRLIKRLNKQ